MGMGGGGGSESSWLGSRLHVLACLVLPVTEADQRKIFGAAAFYALSLTARVVILFQLASSKLEEDWSIQ